MKNYLGSCHCGKIQFEVKAKINHLIECNCSFCEKRGGLLFRVSPKQFKLLSDKNDFEIYRFNTKKARHYFCKHCGIHCFSNPRIAPDMVTINARCLDNFDLQTEQYQIVKFDGRHWEESIEKLSKTFKID